MQRRKTSIALMVLRTILILIIIFLAFSDKVMERVALALPRPSALTEATAASARENSETLYQVQTALPNFEFGLAPLFYLDESQVIINATGPAPYAQLTYPKQPRFADEWPGFDSFVTAYAVRHQLLNQPNVHQVALGTFNVSASTEDYFDFVNHTAVWVTFDDGSQAIIDMTPLATTYGPRHFARSLSREGKKIERQFTKQRSRLNLNHLQPLKIVEQAGQPYYLLTKVMVYADRYEFYLAVYQVNTATSTQPIQLVEGARVRITLEQSTFDWAQAQLLAAGEESFSKNQTLFTRQGSPDPTLNAILDDNLTLMWHIIIKLKRQVNQ